ncbi:MAG: diguanylate cyclase domain-containing protein [Sulfobacillus sp.]
MSIGIASNTSSSLPQLLEVVRQADRALYEAKASGRNRIVTKALGRESV